MYDTFKEQILKQILKYILGKRRFFYNYILNAIHLLNKKREFTNTGKRFIQLQIKHSLQHWHIFRPF